MTLLANCLATPVARAYANSAPMASQERGTATSADTVQLSSGAEVQLKPGAPKPTNQPPAPDPNWKLVWSDEFNAPNGSAPDPSKWGLDISGDGFGNHELEYYTDRPDNAIIADGNLVITARK